MKSQGWPGTSWGSWYTGPSCEHQQKSSSCKIKEWTSLASRSFNGVKKLEHLTEGTYLVVYTVSYEPCKEKRAETSVEHNPSTVTKTKTWPTFLGRFKQMNKDTLCHEIPLSECKWLYLCHQFVVHSFIRHHFYLSRSFLLHRLQGCGNITVEVIAQAWTVRLLPQADLFPQNRLYSRELMSTQVLQNAIDVVRHLLNSWLALHTSIQLLDDQVSSEIIKSNATRMWLPSRRWYSRTLQSEEVMEDASAHWISTLNITQAPDRSTLIVTQETYATDQRKESDQKNPPKQESIPCW